MIDERSTSLRCQRGRRCFVCAVDMHVVYSAHKNAKCRQFMRGSCERTWPLGPLRTGVEFRKREMTYCILHLGMPDGAQHGGGNTVDYWFGPAGTTL